MSTAPPSAWFPSRVATVRNLSATVREGNQAEGGAVLIACAE